MDQPVAVVTGAGRGIGRATAIELAACGYRLVLVSRNERELHETARLSGPSDSTSFAKSLVETADVTQSAEVNRVIETGINHFGRLDAVVHCAGLAPACSIAAMTDAEWHAVIDTNLSAAFYLCRAAWPVFERQRHGVFVNVSSAAARDPFPGFAAYGAAKAGVNLFGLSAAREGEPVNIRVHTIAPAATETAMLRKLLTPEQYSPDKAMQPADVARVIVQCVRGDLQYTTGETLYLHKNL